MTPSQHAPTIRNGNLNTKRKSPGGVPPAMVGRPPRVTIRNCNLNTKIKSTRGGSPSHGWAPPPRIEWLTSFFFQAFGLDNRVRGLNKRMPSHKEIDVSMCNGILRIWLGHVAHLLISLNHRIRRLNHLIISSAHLICSSHLLISSAHLI